MRFFFGGKNSRAKRESDKAPSEHGDGATPGQGAGNLVFFVWCQLSTADSCEAQKDPILLEMDGMSYHFFYPSSMIQWISPRLEGFTECISMGVLASASGGVPGIRDLGKNG